jgi:beta-glucosidase-like glycosyl hydrolase
VTVILRPAPGQNLRDLSKAVAEVTDQSLSVGFGGLVVSDEIAHDYLSRLLGRSAPAEPARVSAGTDAGADPPPRKATKKAAPRKAATKTTPAARSRTAQRTGE